MQQTQNYNNIPEIYRHLVDVKTNKIVKREGDDKWSMLEGGVKKSEALGHLTNGIKYGVGFIEAGTDVVRKAALDLDDHDGDVGWSGMTDLAMALIDACHNRGLHAHAYRSGGGNGINLWYVWEEYQDAYSVRALLREIISDLGYREGSGGVAKGQIEVFPKQDNVPEDGKGNCLALPLYALDPFALEDVGAVDEWDGVHFSKPVEVREQVKQDVSTIQQVEQLTHEQIDELLQYIDPVGMDQDQWFRVVAAIKNCGGTWDQAVDWTDRDPMWAGKEDEWRVRYDSFNRVTDGVGGEVVGAGSLRYWASANGWEGAKADLAVFPEADVGMNYMHDKQGKIIPTSAQVNACLLRDPTFSWYINYDEFFGEIFVTEKATGKSERLGDHHYTLFRIWFDDNGWREVGKEKVRDAVYFTARRQSGDIMRSWMRGLVWDGVDRVGQFVAALGLDATKYHDAVARYILTGMVARQIDPACQLDITPILIGKQGVGKTRSCLALAPKFVDTLTSAECAATDLIDMDRSARLVRGKCIVILDELRGMKREREAIKAAMTRSVEEHTPKYMENRVQYKRRCLLIGTTNEEEFLDDPTGARRFAPVRVSMKADPKWIEGNLEQLWAQGLDMHGRVGVNWEQVQDMAAEVHEEHTVSDVWEPRVYAYLETIVDEWVTTEDILTHALGIEVARQGKAEQMRVADLLRSLGYERKYKMIDTVKRRRWKKA